MRRVRYAVASSLDGFIAGPKGEADWIIMDPGIGFDEFFSQFDTLLIGRRTFEAMRSMGGGSGSMPGMNSLVFSRTLRQSDHPNITIVNDAEKTVADLKSKPGKDIWLFGGGLLFRSLAAAGLVDTVELGVMPVLLGEGIPLAPGPANQIKLKLTGHKIYSTGIVSLEYEIGSRKRPKGRRS